LKKQGVNNKNKLTMWLRTVLTLFIFGMFCQIIYLLFHPTLELDDQFRDLLNIIIGAFLASFSKIVDFWFNKDKKDE
jgi:uncharacterized membrane protein YczE|tara:strand:+ start:413 stop:643 length:231 start_codon:yes stop_codon:yes gene_type:complete